MPTDNVTVSHRLNGYHGLGFAVGGIMAMLLTAASEAAYAGYSVRLDAISGLGGAGSPTELFWDTQLLIVGILWLADSYLLFHGKGKTLNSAVFYLAGAGLIMVSVSPYNVYPVSHYIGAQFVFLFGALSCISGYRMTSGPMKVISLASGIISVSAYLSGYAGAYSVLGSGGLERMIFYPVFLWEICFGGYLLNKGASSADG
jgi:hypothetical membrane protein